jgi:hypothetical protein
MQSYTDSYLYAGRESFKVNWCQPDSNTIPEHFDICPSSVKVLKQLCSEHNLFIQQYVELESIFLKQEKLFLCEKLKQGEAIDIMKNIHNKMSTLLNPHKYLSHHQSHLDVVLGKRTDMPSNKMNKKQLCSSI